MAKSPNKKYEELGKMLVSIYESGYLDKNKTYKQSFIKGVIGGLGGVLGATVLIAILLWILSLLHYVPVSFIKEIPDKVNQQVETR